MLQAAGVSTSGPRGEVRLRGLLAVWLWGVRAWERDESEDLSGTMAAVDAALQRAEQIASWLHGQGSTAPPPPPVSEGAGELDPSAPPLPRNRRHPGQPVIRRRPGLRHERSTTPGAHRCCHGSRGTGR